MIPVPMGMFTSGLSAGLMKGFMIDLYNYFLPDWESELLASDCPFSLESWTGTLAACLFCAAMLEDTRPKGNN